MGREARLCCWGRVEESGLEPGDEEESPACCWEGMKESGLEPGEEE